MTEDDKCLITEWLHLADNPKLQGPYSSDDWYSLGKCKEKIVADGKWEGRDSGFCNYAWRNWLKSSDRKMSFENWFFTPQNFFPLVAAWLREEGT